MAGIPAIGTVHPRRLPSPPEGPVLPWAADHGLGEASALEVLAALVPAAAFPVEVVFPVGAAAAVDFPEAAALEVHEVAASAAAGVAALAAGADRG